MVFTRITNGQSIDAATFNNPMTQLETGLQGGLTTIASGILGSSAFAISITSIPATFKDLILVANMASVSPSTITAGTIRLNSSSASVYYSFQSTQKSGGVGYYEVVSTPATAHFIDNMIGPSSDIKSTITVEFLNYAALSATVMMARGFTYSATVGQSSLYLNGGVFNSPVTINRIDLRSSGAADFVAGTNYKLYGRGLA